MSEKLGSVFCLDSFAQVTQPQVCLRILFLFFFLMMFRCKIVRQLTHVTCNCLKILIIVFFCLIAEMQYVF